jgi:Family of unknown function (DUF6062)
MIKGHSYFVLLEEFKLPGCPLCSLAIKDGRSFLDSLLYESVLDVPLRLKLMDSFGFCNRHAWEIPKLPAICSPAAGFAIFASDLLRKFNLLVGARAQEPRKKSLWSFLFRHGSRKLSLEMKARVCPACDHVAQFEAFHLADLLDSITESEFREALDASQGICLPHLFLVEEKYSNHPNFPLLLQLQLDKSQSLRKRLEEFIRKQDRRFQQDITADEAKAWRVAMEFLVGKPGVFNNEIRADPRPNGDGMPVEETVKKTSRIDGVAVGDLIAQFKTAKQVTVYQKQPLPTHLLKSLRDLVSAEMHPEVEIVAEDLSDVIYLRQLHSAGFELFYGVGLPRQPLIFMNSGRGFVVEDNPEAAGVRRLPSKDAENLYFRLLWRRFGHAVSFTGVVKERDPQKSLFCLKLDRDREIWCRLRTAGPGVMPDVGKKVAVFAWEKWVTHILDVIHLELLSGR